MYKKRNDTPIIVQQKILATRLFITLLLFITFVLVLITGFDQRTKTITLDTPSALQFENLVNTNAVAVSCPCSKIAIPYSRFITLVPTLHQICLSDFLSDDWMDRLVFSTSSDAIPYYHLDIRSYGLTTFRTLRNLCTVMNATLMDALKNFQTIQLISIQALSHEQWKREVHTIITDFQSTIADTFRQTSQMAHEIIHGNQLLTTTLSNVFAQSQFNDSGIAFSVQLQLGIRLNANDTSSSCSCLLDTCTQQLAFYNISDSYTTPILLFSIPGMRSACYPLDGFRLSTLECWFNETCITLLRMHLAPISVEQIIPALDTTKQRRFSLSATLGEILDEMMIEEWTNVTNYEAYFSTCRPLTCNYLIFHRLDLLYTITTVISIFGGLCVILRKFCPLLIRFYVRFRVQCQPYRVNPSAGISILICLKIILITKLCFHSLRLWLGCSQNKSQPINTCTPSNFNR